MFAIVGAAGKVGYSTSLALRQAGAPVRAVLRDEAKASRLRAIGCDVALADLRDPAALGQALAGADTVQVILPPLPRAEDAASEMRHSAESLVAALAHARPSRVLAISDYGAHVGDDIGMPTQYRLFEERLRRLDAAQLFLRSAEHMQGWTGFVRVAIATGSLPSMHHPLDKNFPTVAAADVGLIAADLLLQPWHDAAVRVVHVEGPRRYSAMDVAAAVGELLGRTITAQELPRGHWQPGLERVLSASTAQLLVDAYDAHNKGGLIEAEPGGDVRRGSTGLIDALRPVVDAALNSR